MSRTKLELCESLGLGFFCLCNEEDPTLMCHHDGERWIDSDGKKIFIAECLTCDSTYTLPVRDHFTMNRIITFTKIDLPYGWLGNMSHFPVIHNDILWLTTEHLFQALRFDKLSPVREEIRREPSPMAAKFVAKRNVAQMTVSPRTDEDLQLMRLVLALKYDQHDWIQTELKKTGDAELIEDVTNRKRKSESDLFWGVFQPKMNTREGQNWLGRLWMEIRDGRHT